MQRITWENCGVSARRVGGNEFELSSKLALGRIDKAGGTIVQVYFAASLVRKELYEPSTACCVADD